MGKKYIIEIPEDKIEDFVGTHFLMPYMMAGHMGSHDTGLPIEPYTEPDIEQVRKEVYAEGLKDGQAVVVANEQNKAFNEGYKKCLTDMERVGKEAYEKGLADAWEAARKIHRMPEGDLPNLFDVYSSVCTPVQAILKYDATEAIAKIKEYEQEQEKIKVGDEVEWNGDRYVVTYIDVDETYVDVIDCSCGSVCDRLAIKGITKTGRHFPEIAAVLEKMRGEQE